MEHPRHQWRSKSRACAIGISVVFAHSRSMTTEADVCRIAIILAVTFIVSLVGFPVLTVPTPRQPDQKPFGVQIIAAPGQESGLFAFGRRIEGQMGFCHRPPPI
jgi:Asp-tRNA(Asn)/Glu-tRNA(Gln) amidotransferase A subunit family amidase